MARTPGFVLPSAYPSVDAAAVEVRRRSEAAGYTPFEPLGFVNDVLEHYGVKGMKWGKVRTRAQIDSDSADVAAVKEAKAKIGTNRTTDVLSNKELQNVVTRMNLEQQYKRLNSESKAGTNPIVKKQLDAGKKAVASMAIRFGEDKIADFIAKKNPAAGIVLKTLLEGKRAAAGEGKKKNNNKKSESDNDE